MGQEYDIHIIWNRVATIMRGEHRDIPIVTAIIVIATPRGSHNIMNTNTQLRQTKGRGGSSMMLSARNLVICLQDKRLLWLSLNV